MTRGNRVRLVGPTLAVTLTAGLCACPPPSPEDCQGLKVVFVSPVEGGQVSSPLSVEVRGENDRGVAYDLATATLSTGPGTATEGIIAGSKATFAGVSLAPGPQVLTATAKKSGTSCPEARGTVNITVQAALPTKVLRCTYPQDANSDGKLNNVELPASAKVQISCDVQNAMGTDLQILLGANVVGGPVTVGTQTAVAVSLDGLPPTDPATFQLFAQLRRGGTPVNTTTSNPEAVSSITVQRQALTCANTTQTLQGPGDDVDGSLTGFQLRATGTVGSGAVSADFTIANIGTSQPSTPVNGDVSGDLTLPPSGDRRYQVVMTARDGMGNVCMAEREIRVDLEKPTVSITAPASGANLTTSPIQVAVQTSGVEDGQQACVYLQSAPTRRYCGAVMGGRATIGLPVTSDGAVTIAADARDQAGNTSDPATVNATVALSGCAIGWGTIQGQPATCPMFVNRLFSGQLNVNLTTNAACTGQTLTMMLDGTQVGTSTAGMFSFPVTDGMHTLTAAPPAGGAISCQIIVDTSQPLITNPATPASGPAIINQTADTQPGTPGAQRFLSFRPESVANGRIDVCVDQNLPGTSGACAGGAGWFVLRSNVTSPVGSLTYPEGTYNMKIVVVATSVGESPPLPLLVDVTAPCVNAGTLRLPQDTSGDGKLNSAELGTASPKVEFAAGCGGATSVNVRQATGTTIYGSLTTVGANPVTVDLTQSIVGEADYDFFVELRDAVGNTNVAATLPAAARLATRIDRTAPNCTISQPSKAGTLNMADVPGGMLAMEVMTSSDVGTNGVSMSVDLGVQMATPSSGVAAASFAVSGTRTLALAATCVDSVGNQSVATPKSVAIDLDAPTCSFSAPTAGTYSNGDLTTTLAVGGAEGRQVVISSSAQMGALGTLTVSGGVATGLIGYPNGVSQTITATLSDSAGNPCTAMLTGLTVNSTSCNLQITSGYLNGVDRWQNRLNTTVTGPTTGTATITARSNNCTTGQTVRLRRTVPSAMDIGMQTTNASGDVSFASVALTDAEVYEVTIDNGMTTTRTFKVDLVAPTAGALTIAGAAVQAGTLYFVAQTGNRKVETMTPNYYPDGDANAGWHGDFVIAAVTGAMQGTATGKVEVLFKGSAAATQMVSTTPVAVTLQTTLPQGDSGTLVVRVTDQAGNELDVASTMGMVDVIAPAAPVVTRNLSNARNATVNLSWGPSYDDGSTSGSGGVAGYDVRWTTDSVRPSGNQLATSADFFGSSANRESESAWSAMTISRDLTLPPLNTYYIAVRARDDVDNYSTYAAPAALTNMWTPVVLTGPTPGDFFGSSVLLESSLNNDAIVDLVVAAPLRASNVGSVFVFYGGNGFASQTGCTPPTCQEISSPAGASGLFGIDLSAAGNVGDVATEGKADLVVGQSGFRHLIGATLTTVGRAVLYFGANGTSISASNLIELRGLDFANRIGTVTRIIKDIDNDGLDELAVAAPFFNGNQGRVYVFKGRNQTAWAAAATATDVTTAAPYIPVSAATATWVLEGPVPNVVAAGNAFGQNRYGLDTIGDINGDGRPEFTVPMSRASINRLMLFSGGVVAASLPASPLNPSNAIQTLTRPTTTDNSPGNGFGASAIGGDVLGVASVDLVASFPAAPGGGQVFFFVDLTSLGAAGGNPSLTITGPLTFGSKMALGAVDGADSRKDLLVGENLVSGNVSWLLYQRAGSFDTSVEIGTPAFQLSRFDGAIISGTATTGLGKSNALGDLDGNGQLDVILGDENNDSVRVWR